MPEQSPTWIRYIKSMQAADHATTDLETEEKDKILSLSQHFNSLFSHSIPMIYLLDYTTGKYIIASNTSLAVGHHHKKYMDNGLDFVRDVYKKDELKLYSEEIFPDRLEILKNIPVHKHKDHVFSYNFNIKSNEGKFINVFQRNCFIKSDASGNPLLSLGMVINAEHFKKSNPVIQVVEKINPCAQSLELVSKKAYFLNAEEQSFSKREIEILLWIADGMTTKQIADRLCISDNTVINHCKSMRLKSNCKNIAELVGLRAGIILFEPQSPPTP